MGSYRDLEIYETAHGLGVSLHQFSLRLPKFELFEIGSQLRRASKSISANIVEGYGRRRHKADYLRFLVMAQASCDETIEWHRYVCDCYPDLQNDAVAFMRTADELGRKINNFIRAVETKHETSNQ